METIMHRHRNSCDVIARRRSFTLPTKQSLFLDKLLNAESRKSTEIASSLRGSLLAMTAQLAGALC